MTTLELIDARGIEYQFVGDEIAVVCPNAVNHQGGRDTHASFKINLDKNVAHCFACGYSMGSRRLLQWLGGEGCDPEELEMLALRSKLRNTSSGEIELYQSKAPVYLPPGRPWDEDGYRGIRLETYARFGALRVERGRYQNRIAFPIRVRGRVVGVDARTLGDDKPKYLRNKGCSCRTDWLFPYDAVVEEKPELLLLGEGIFHALNAFDKGFAALCFFGAHNWSQSKVRMVLSTGAREVCFFRDNDRAGRKSEQKVLASLAPWIEISAADVSGLDSGLDLGDLDAGTIQKCINKRYEPDIPVCLAHEAEPEPLADCHHVTCPFNKVRQCHNSDWLKVKSIQE